MQGAAVPGRWAMLVGVAVGAAGAHAQDLVLQVVPRPAELSEWHGEAVSRDGRVVAGHGRLADGLRGGAPLVRFIYTIGPGPGTLESIPDDGIDVGSIEAVSDDGATLMAEAQFGGQYVWRRGHGWLALEDFDGGIDANLKGMSADGHRIVGFATENGRSHAALWMAGSAAPSRLAELNDPVCGSSADGISALGLTIVGQSDLTDCDADDRAAHAARWEGGGITDLGTLPGHRHSYALAVSANGLHAVGAAATADFDYRLVRWFLGVPQDLGPLNLGHGNRNATDIADGGDRILHTRIPTNAHPNYASGIRADGASMPVIDYVRGRTGQDLAGWTDQFFALRLHGDDGLVGVGHRTDGVAEIWRLAPRCAADFDGDGSATPADFAAFRAAFLAGDPRADYDGDGSLDPNDFTAFRAALLAGCG